MAFSFAVFFIKHGVSQTEGEELRQQENRHQSYDTRPDITDAVAIQALIDVDEEIMVQREDVGENCITPNSELADIAIRIWLGNASNINNPKPCDDNTARNPQSIMRETPH